jgi:hypothetical protein
VTIQQISPQHCQRRSRSPTSPIPKPSERFHNDGLSLAFSNTGPMSEPLKAALRTAISRAMWASASRQLGLYPGAHHRPHDLDARLELHHVPRLFWPEDYHREIADLLDDDLAPWHGRRLCSMLLARMLSPLDWDTAARYLHLPEPFTDTGYDTTFTKLRSNDEFTELASRIKRIANQHAKNRLIDYRQGSASPADLENAPGFRYASQTQLH